MSINSTPVKVEGNSLVFSNNARVTFQRTLRIPQDGKVYALPPSLGTFPIHKVDDFKHKVPASWLQHGGVFIPMFQAEAMWLQFSGDQYAPKAVKIGIGKVNAISGKPWSNSLELNKQQIVQQQHSSGFWPFQQTVSTTTTTVTTSTQDYAVIPRQPWIDGINSGGDYIKQFIAEPLGSGLTVEAQVTGKEDVGGMQLMMFDPKVPLARPQQRRPQYRNKKASLFANQSMAESTLSYSGNDYAECDYAMECCDAAAPAAAVSSAQSFSKSARVSSSVAKPKAMEMGLGAGGNISQKIFDDPYGGEAFWNQHSYQRIFVHIVNSEMYYQITGKRLTSTVNAGTYKRYGYQWYSLYDEHIPHVQASPILSQVKSVQQIQQEQQQQYYYNNSNYPYAQVKQQNWPLADHQLNKKNAVRDGSW